MHIDLDAEIPDRAFEFRVPDEDIAGLIVESVIAPPRAALDDAAPSRPPSVAVHPTERRRAAPEGRVQWLVRNGFAEILHVYPTRRPILTHHFVNL